MGVIQVVKDLSGDMQAIVDLQKRIIVVSLLIMGILFGVLAYIVNAGRSMSQRVLVRRRMLEEKLNEAERLGESSARWLPRFPTR